VVNPQATLKNFLEIYQRSREKKQPNQTLCFGHKKKDGIHCTVYDKKRELSEQSIYKIDYFDTWFEYPYDNLYRVEIELRNPQIRSLCSVASDIRKDWEHGPRLVDHLQSSEFLTFMFHTALSSVMHFVRDGKRIEVWEL
jgi:hypothetical protein